MCKASDEACYNLPNPKWHLVLLAVAKRYSRKLYMIEAKYNEANIASSGLLKKLGFQVDGILRDRRMDLVAFL